MYSFLSFINSIQIFLLQLRNFRISPKVDRILKVVLMQRLRMNFHLQHDPPNKTRRNPTWIIFPQATRTVIFRENRTLLSNLSVILHQNYHQASLYYHQSQLSHLLRLLPETALQQAGIIGQAHCAQDL